MATTKFYLDSRSGGAPYPLKLTITHDRKAVHYPLGIKLEPEQWNGIMVVKHPRAGMLNNQLIAQKADIDTKLYEWKRAGKLGGKTAKEIKEMLEADEKGEEPKVETFAEFFLRQADRKKKGTRDLYMATYRKLECYTNIEKLTFEDITTAWMVDFDIWLGEQMPSVNSRAMYYRNIRAVFNDAIDEGLTNNYPFRRFKIKKVETTKRSLTLQQLYTLLEWPVEEYQKQYVDMFLLMILLRGINLVDLCGLTEKNIINGRLEYYRAKTEKLYSIKMEPEIWALIDRYRGEKYLVNIMDRYADYKSYKSRINKELKRIGTIKVSKHGKKTIKPLFPNLSTYWARHTFASVGYNDCGLSMDIISDELGHSNGMAVTNIYVRKDIDKIDLAARKIIDKVLYGK